MPKREPTTKIELRRLLAKERRQRLANEEELKAARAERDHLEILYKQLRQEFKDVTRPRGA